MPTTAINMPLYRVLRALDVSDGDAEAASQAASQPQPEPIDLSHLATREELRAETAKLATKDELRVEVAKLVTKEEFHAEVARLATKEELRAEIAQAMLKQTVWLGAAIFAAAGLVIAVQRLAPAAASTGLSVDAVRVIVEQAMRDVQPR